jgi:UDP-2-acetamido-2-deoxy-ribo-hexuluronate aminotransferase
MHPKPLKKIQMVDLQSQYVELKLELDAAIAEVLEEAQFIKGRQIRSFENNLATYLHVNHVIACANGTDALQIAMMALDLKPGDEIITTSFTYVATAEVMGLLGLVPVLIEVDAETFNMDANKIEAAITSKTKAIVPVHLFGQIADMEPILHIAKAHDIYVIEDTAQAIGAAYSFKDGTVKYAGTMGNIGTTSFFPSKNLGCYGDGGAIFCNDDELAKKIRMIANHGQSVQYTHDIIGVNSRLDTIQAAILDVKLKYLSAYNAKRSNIAKKYDAAFAGINALTIPKKSTFGTHVYHQYTLKVNNGDRDGLRSYLAEQGIPSMVYYPKPLHHQKAFTSAVFDAEELKLTEALCTQVLSLPMSPNLEGDQQEYIIEHVKHYLNTK